MARYIAGGAQLIYVWVVDLIYETDARGFIGIVIWKLDVDFPIAALVWCWLTLAMRYIRHIPTNVMARTLFWAFETDVEFLHVVVYESDFVVAHQPLLSCQ